MRYRVLVVIGVLDTSPYPGGLAMFGDLAQKAKRNLCLGMLLIPFSFAISELLIGCGGGTSWMSPNDSSITHFGYTGSPLVGTFAPASKAMSDAFFGMTIHRLVAN